MATDVSQGQTADRSTACGSRGQTAPRPCSRPQFQRPNVNANSCFLNVAVFQAARRDDTEKLLSMSANAGKLHQQRCKPIRSATAADLRTTWACCDCDCIPQQSQFTTPFWGRCMHVATHSQSSQRPRKNYAKAQSLFILQIVHRFHYRCTLHQDVLDLIRGAVAIDNVRIKCRMDLLQLLVQFLEVALLLRVCLQVKCK